MRIFAKLAACAFLFSVQGFEGFPQGASTPTEASSPEINGSTPLNPGKPNFLIIVADDMGWSDLGFLGSAINTPHLNALAQQGVFLTDFYVAPSCSPTRSMLLTGVSNHAAGVGTMHRLQRPNQLDNLNYGAQLHDGVVTVAEALRSNGYRTMMAGKWHLALEDEQKPGNRGFDRSYGLVEGGASHFSDQKVITPWENVTYEEDGELVELDADFYSTIAYTDKIIDYIKEAQDQPFFAYLPYTAPHDPLQVPDDWMDRYAGVFDAGPAPFEAAVMDRLSELDLYPERAERAPAPNLPPFLPSHRKSWAERTDAERAEYARRMEIYASMIELMDQQIGRVIENLRASGKLENTYILFFSDNGAAAGTPFVYGGSTRKWVHESFDLSFEQMGQPGSYTTMGAEWAHVSNSPFRLFKGTVAEGGVRSPLLISGPELRSGALIQSPAHVMDIAPTLFELSGFDPVSSPLYEGKLNPVGTSLAPVLREQGTAEDRLLITNLFGQKMVRMGSWKATQIPPPLGNGRWELFDIEADPSETRDVADRHPDILSDLMQAYQAFADENGVIDPKPHFSVRMHTSFEGHCNWWCLTKFGFVDTLINPHLRNRALTIVFILIGGLISLIFLWRRKRASRS